MITEQTEKCFLAYCASVTASLPNFPKGVQKWFGTLEPEQKRFWFEERFKCLKDPLYLGGYADDSTPEKPIANLGMDFQVDPHKLLFEQFPAMLPGENLVLSDLSTIIKKFMILWSRGCFKTSSVRVKIVQIILNYPNVRLCFLTGGDQLAKRQLSAVKHFFEKPTSRFKWLFPEFCLKSVRNRKITDEDDPRAWSDQPARLGTAHEFTVPCRTSEIFAEPTFAISTARSVKAGSHFDIIFIDDLVHEGNFRSVQLLEKCYEDYLMICPLLEPTGYIIMTGTRYSFGDTYERIQDAAREEEKLLGHTIWKFSIRDCWSRSCQNCVHTNAYHDYDANIIEPPCTVLGCTCLGFKDRGVKGVLFPQTRTIDGRSIGHTLEFLEGERIRLGDELFANQYENQPIATGSQTFTETLIGKQTLHDLAQIPSYAQSYTFAVGDLAYVGQSGRDASVIFICRLHQGRIYIFDCVFGNWDSDKVAEHTINVLLRHRPATMFFEKINGWDAFNRVITSYATDKGVQNVPLQWIKGSQTANAKLIRIGSVKGPLATGRLWFYAGMPGYNKLVQQLLKWPKLGKHDDMADACGMCVEAPTGYQMQQAPVAVPISHWLRKLNSSEATPDDAYDNGCGSGICC